VEKEVGKTYTFIYDIEKDKKMPSLETVIKLAEIYKDISLVAKFVNLKMEDQGLSINEAILFGDFRNRLVHHKVESILEENPSALSDLMSMLETYERTKDKE
jgi:DNA-binding XRE family transcriptional regulator